MMDQKNSVGIAVRAHRGIVQLSLFMAATMAVGCGHSRQSYRPIYTSPAPASTPCTNCGSSSSVTPSDGSLGPATSTPAISTPSTIESTVPSLSPPAAPSAGAASSRGSSIEATPRASIGGEPEFDAPLSPTTQRGGVNSALPQKSGATQGPSLQPPASGPAPAALNRKAPGVETAYSVTTTSVARRNVLSDRLRPFVDDQRADELLYPAKADRPWKYVVLHHSATTEGSYDQIDAEHRKTLGFDGCGYHFVIGNGTQSGDGEIEVARRWSTQKQGLHCRNARTHEVDEYGIGICLVGDFEKAPPTPRQVEAARALIAYLSRRYNISESRVTTHKNLAASPTICPGKYFPAESILPTPRGAAQSTPVRATWRAVGDRKETASY
jgi:N-acetyl-anhydromuramyl-L-alanine amidase AmpD